MRWAYPPSVAVSLGSKSHFVYATGHILYAHGTYYVRGRCSLRILIVDDSQVVRKTLRGTLERHDGWRVCGEAADGREGIEQAQKLMPDLIVLDFSMPVMNGLEAARELTRLLPTLPIVMFTNYGTDYLHEEALSAGARAVLSKSDSVQALLNTIQSFSKPLAAA